MNKEIEMILNKTKAVINSAEHQHKDVVRRFIFLANRRLHQLCQKHTGDLWVMIRGTFVIYNLYESKFCYKAGFNDD